MMDDASRLRALAQLARALASVDRPEDLVRLAIEAVRTTLAVGAVSCTRADQAATIPPAPAPSAQPSPAADQILRAGDLLVPLVVDGRPWGELRATPAPGADPFDETDLAHVEVLGALLTGALGRATRAVQHDSAAGAGLLNRAALESAAAHLLHRASTGHRVSAVAVELSGAGDRTAGDRTDALATLLMHHFAPLTGSLVARVGNTEFSVLVPGHPVDHVVAAAEAFCAEAGEPFCGVATTTGSQPWETVQHLFQAADRALAESRRREGRPQVVG